MRYLFLAICCFNLFGLNEKISANNRKQDTLQVKQLADSSSFYAFTNSLKSIAYGKKALALAQQLKELKAEAYGHMSLARAYYVKGEYGQSLNHGTKLIDISKQINYGYGLAFGINNGGLIYLAQEQYVLASEEFSKALELNQKLRNLVGQSSNLFNLALCQIGLENYAAADEYLRQCMGLAQKANPRVYIMAINRLGDVAAKRKQWDKAISFYEDALTANNIGDDWEKAYAYLGIAIVSHDSGQYQRSIINAEKALGLLRNINAQWDMVRVYDILQDAHEKLKTTHRPLLI